MFTLFFVFIWINFSIQVINQIALAQVEDGYLEQTNEYYQDWLTKPIRDPGIPSKLDEIKQNAGTIPSALKSYNQQKSNFIGADSS